MNLFYLFPHRIINLPMMRILEGYEFEEELGDIDYTRYVEKIEVSSDPLYSTDYVLALIQGAPATFAFWRPGDTSFNSLGITIPDCAYSDITWHDGKFYGVNFMVTLSS
ncbi:hypothetical protein BC332_11150 [Capsicum chinense]|nr:hypothetical protein BC332_11150 [Capsicum chinense]